MTRVLVSVVCLGTAVGLSAVPGCSSTAPGPATSARPTVSAADVDLLVGSGWSGTLTYLDYMSGKPYTMPATLAVERVAGAAEPTWRLKLGYPDEPKADSVRLVVLSEGGAVFDGEAVVERSPLVSGGVRLVTEGEGEDDHRPAWFRHEYEFGRGSCSIRKLVRFQGETTFLERNAYRWRRPAEAR